MSYTFIHIDHYSKFIPYVAASLTFEGLLGGYILGQW